MPVLAFGRFGEVLAKLRDEGEENPHCFTLDGLTKGK